MDWKLIIFDMDGTLYDLQDVLDMNYQIQLDFYSCCQDISCSETESVFREHHILPYISSEAKSATEFFAKSGISTKQWQNYRNEHFDVERINIDKAVNDSIIRKFHSNYRMALLTSNSLQNTKKILKHLKISLTNFDVIVCSDYNYPTNEMFEKFHAMKYILSVFAAEPKECLSIGDRYATDVAPMLKLGGAGVIVKNPKALCDVYECLMGRNTCDESFEFYCSRSCRMSLSEDTEL